MERMQQNLAAIKEYLTLQGIKYWCDEKGSITSGFRDARINFRVSDELASAQLCFVKEVPDTAYSEVLDYLNKVNTILAEGHFEVKRGHGVSYRLSFRVGERALQTSQVEEMLDYCSNMAGWFGAAFYRIIDEKISAEDAFDQVVTEIVKTIN